MSHWRRRAEVAVAVVAACAVGGTATVGCAPSPRPSLTAGTSKTVVNPNLGADLLRFSGPLGAHLDTIVCTTAESTSRITLGTESVEPVSLITNYDPGLKDPFREGPQIIGEHGPKPIACVAEVMSWPGSRSIDAAIVEFNNPKGSVADDSFTRIVSPDDLFSQRGIPRDPGDLPADQATKKPVKTSPKLLMSSVAFPNQNQWLLEYASLPNPQTFTRYLQLRVLLSYFRLPTALPRGVTTSLRRRGPWAEPHSYAGSCGI